MDRLSTLGKQRAAELRGKWVRIVSDMRAEKWADRQVTGVDWLPEKNGLAVFLSAPLCVDWDNLPEMAKSMILVDPEHLKCLTTMGHATLHIL